MDNKEKRAATVDFVETVIDGVLEAEEDEVEAGSFEDGTRRLAGVVKKVGKKGLSDPAAVMEALGTLASVAADTMKYVSAQETKQQEIRAKRDVAIAQINATSELIKTYLDKTFDERRTIFNKQFEVVDTALRTGNTDMLAMSLNSINQLAAQSPFKCLADINEVKRALQDDDYEWDI